MGCFRVLLLGAFAALASAEYCHGKPDPNAKPNLYPIYTNPPTHVKSVPNGHLYSVGDEISNFSIVHLYGTPYQMGYAQGKLHGPRIIQFMESVYSYIEAEAMEAVNDTIPWFPAKIAKEIIDKGLTNVLDAEIAATKQFSGSYFHEEIQGMADATQYDPKKIERIHLFGELTKGSCSMFGAWAEAIPTDYSLIQLRALDWDTEGPFRDYPQVTIYHPNKNATGQHTFANVGFSGFIGSFSGMSESLGTSEIGVSYPDETFGSESRFGIPFTYLLRDILQFDDSLVAAQTRINEASRTCDLILGVGDGKNKNFSAVEYSHSVANWQTPENMMPEAGHPRIDDVVYYGMDWNCPNYHKVMARQIQAAYGVITPELAIKNITAILQSGNLFLSYYDLTPAHPTMFMSFAAPHGASGPMDAYARQFIRLDMQQLFAIERPS